MGTRSIASMKKRAARVGSHWFERGTMRFFNSKIESPGLEDPCGGAVFVSSEKFDDRSPRLYSVRRQKANGHIDTIGDFQRFRTRAAAFEARTREAQRCHGKKKKKRSR